MNLELLNRSPQSQRGISIWALIYLLFTMGLMLLVAFKSVPVYLNANEISGALEWAAEQPDLVTAPAARIQSAIQRRFDSGYVSNLAGRDVAVERIAGGDARALSVEWEVREPLMFNIDLVYSFDRSVRLTGAPSD